MTILGDTTGGLIAALVLLVIALMAIVFALGVITGMRVLQQDLKREGWKIKWVRDEPTTGA